MNHRNSRWTRSVQRWKPWLWARISIRRPGFWEYVPSLIAWFFFLTILILLQISCRQFALVYFFSMLPFLNRFFVWRALSLQIATRSNKNDVAIMTRIPGTTIGAAPFFQLTAILHVMTDAIRVLEPGAFLSLDTHSSLLCVSSRFSPIAWCWLFPFPSLDLEIHDRLLLHRYVRMLEKQEKRYKVTPQSILTCLQILKIWLLRTHIKVQDWTRGCWSIIYITKYVFSLISILLQTDSHDRTLYHITLPIFVSHCGHMHDTRKLYLFTGYTHTCPLCF